MLSAQVSSHFFHFYFHFHFYVYFYFFISRLLSVMPNKYVRANNSTFRIIWYLVDDSGVFATKLSEEFLHVQRGFNLSREEIIRIAGKLLSPISSHLISNWYRLIWLYCCYGEISVYCPLFYFIFILNDRHDIMPSTSILRSFILYNDLLHYFI